MSRPLYAFQDKLPHLPVPDLKETCAKYLRTVRPLLDDTAFARTEKVVEKFQQPGGLGEQLQKRLQERAADPKVDNWLEEWWNEVAYMGYRDPIVVNVSFFFAFQDDRLRRAQASRAASIVTAAMDFREQVVNETLEPEYTKKNPLCSLAYRNIFNTCRYPVKPSDKLRSFDPTTHQHLAVMRKNQVFVFDLVQNGKRLSTADIELQLNRIISQAGDRKAQAIGALTTEHRDTWTDVRRQLLAVSPRNETVLEKLESAVFLLCLDDTSPVTRDEVSTACWHGDGRNRYFDKSLQYVVFENGKAGVIIEHSGVDGTPLSRLNDTVCDRLAKNQVNHGNLTANTSLPAPTRLDFELDDKVVQAISTAERNFDQLVGKHELSVLAYSTYGKNLIKRFRMSPDAYVQMVIQLAYFKKYGVSRPTYESAQTRKFKHGRTETCRTVSSDSVAFVKAMEDPALPTDKKAAALRQAVTSHVKYMSDAVEGRGVDRHLFGLRMLLKSNEEKPEIFTDPAYPESCHWYLSTSQLTSEYFDGYGWGEVVPDGYGVAYMIKENSLHFNVTSMKLGSKQMTHYLAEAADDMRQVMEASLAAEAAKAKL
ncbi:acyltransferase ChoActase/COT/CPT [Syncephalis plumigaleata]|nr:acyltransferase ChoActase/COT/CPT [Syncephalis plumigaleata]